MSAMDPERWRRVEVILDGAMDLEPDARPAFLDEACAGQDDLRAEVESLLAADATGSLPTRPSAEDFDLLGEDEADLRHVGPYRLLERLGEGGMGEVWAAEQSEPVRRRVALKLIKWGMDTKEVVARFESERQALALMDHPNIAKVYDAGASEKGRPYFAMELVNGVPISRHCDTHRLDLRERLELMIRVCEGIQHAHHKAIIHRDIKPSNVLVTIQGGQAVPKIIDFGIAKAVGGRLTEKTLFTQLGQLIGTPEYMSPEQAEMSGQEIDPRTDVYSLGVLLYQQLTGVLPFEPKELRKDGFDGIRRKIREEEPLKPSARLANLSEELGGKSAARRKTEFGLLRRQMLEGLDWIAMKALAKDRTQRYGSPSELGADIRRYLSGEPVLARPAGEGVMTDAGTDLTPDQREIPLAWLAITRAAQPSEQARLFRIAEWRMLIGREVGKTHVKLGDPKVGRQHAAVRFENTPESDSPEFVLYDLASTNGTKVNGERISSPRVLKDGDSIAVGSTALVFKRA